MSDKPPDRPFYQPLIETIKDIIMSDKEEGQAPVSVRQQRESRAHPEQASATPNQTAPGTPVHSPPPPPSGQHPQQNPQLPEGEEPTAQDDPKAREERLIRQRLARSKAFRSRGWRV